MDTATRLRLAVEQKDRAAACTILKNADADDLNVITIDGIPMGDIIRNLSASVEELVELLIPVAGSMTAERPTMSPSSPLSYQEVQDAEVIQHMLEGATWQDAYDGGIAALAESRYEDAIDEFSKAICLKPRYAEAYAERGWAQYRLMEYEKAFTDCCDAIRIDPCVAKGYYGRALVRMVNKQCDECITDCNTAIRLQPEVPDPHCLRGSARLVQCRFAIDRTKSGLFAQAIMDFTEAIRLRPEYAEAYYNRGLAYGEQGDMKKAIPDFAEAMRLDPSIEKTYLSGAVQASVDPESAEASVPNTPRVFTLPGDL